MVIFTFMKSNILFAYLLFLSFLFLQHRDVSESVDYYGSLNGLSFLAKPSNRFLEIQGLNAKVSKGLRSSLRFKI